MDLFGKKARAERDSIAVAAYKLVSDLRTVNKAYDAEILRLRTHIDILKAEVKNLTPKPIKNHPLYLNETEEDIEYAFKNELIDKDQYEDMLRQLEFDNTDITFDLEIY